MINRGVICQGCTLGLKRLEPGLILVFGLNASALVSVSRLNVLISVTYLNLHEVL